MMSPRNARVGAATMALGKAVGERSDGTRFLRGAELMERGKVIALTVSHGRANGSVQGSSHAPYVVEIVSKADRVFPSSSSQLTFRCSCPDWGDPCKHAVAVTLELADRLDDDPELLARFLGLEAMTHLPRPGAAVTPPTSAALETVAPVWASTVRPPALPIDAAAFFGRPNPPSLTASSPTPSSIGRKTPMGDLPADRLRALGPLVVDGYDLAPDIVRLFETLTGNAAPH